MGNARRVGTVLVVLVALGASTAAARDAGAVRATLLKRGAKAILVGNLNGRTLSWRLTHHGLGRTVRSADLHLAGRTARLCAPCRQSAAGRVPLTVAGARAARSGAASVVVTGSTAVIRGKLAFGTVPTLQVDGVTDGSVLALPAVLHFTVTGYQVGPGHGTIVARTPFGPLPLKAAADGHSYTIPDDKVNSGIHDLTFVLTDAAGHALTNPEASVTVYRVLLAGRR